MFCLRPSNIVLNSSIKMYKAVRLKTYAARTGFLNKTDSSLSLKIFQNHLEHRGSLCSSKMSVHRAASASTIIKYLLKRDYSLLRQTFINSSCCCNLAFTQTLSANFFQHQNFHKFTNPYMCKTRSPEQLPQNGTSKNEHPVGSESEDAGDIARQYVKEKNVKGENPGYKADSVDNQLPKESLKSPEKLPDKPSIFQRFKKTYKEHGKVAVAVFIAMSIFWYGTAYAVTVTAAYYGLDLMTYIVPVLEKFNLSETFIKQSKSMGTLAVAIFIVKMLSPIKYGSIYYAIHRAVIYLRKTGRMQHIAKEDTLRSLATESSVIIKRRYKKANLRQDMRTGLRLARINVRKGMSNARSDVNNRMNRARTRFNSSKKTLSRKNSKSDQ